MLAFLWLRSPRFAGSSTSGSQEITSGQSPLQNALIQQMLGKLLTSGGFTIPNSFPEVAVATYTKPVRDRWLEDDSNAFSETCKHIYCLGFLFRFVALVSLVYVSKSQATGGGAVCETPDGKTSSKNRHARLSAVLFAAFLIVVVHFELRVILGMT